MNLKFLTLCVAASFSCISTAEVLENTENAAPDYYDESYNREDDGPIAEDTAIYGIVSQDGEKNIFTRPETVKLKAGSGSITEFAEEKDLSHSSADRQSAQGEYHYRRHGNDYNIKYNFAADSAEEVASMVDNFYSRMLSQYKSDEITVRYGNISQPKYWYEDTTPGEIHEGTVEGKRTLFESKFTGNTSILKAYYPTNRKDNKWWRVIHPVEYYAMTADPQYPWLETEAKSRDVILEQYTLLNTLKKTYGDAYRGTIINGDITAFGHDWQWKFMKQALGTLNHPYWYGLGNHDYDNNVNDCALHENRCAIRSVRNLVDHINSAPDVQAVDYSVISGYKRAALDTTYTGSFSYSFDIGGIPSFNRILNRVTSGRLLALILPMPAAIPSMCKNLTPGWKSKWLRRVKKVKRLYYCVTHRNRSPKLTVKSPRGVSKNTMLTTGLLPGVAVNTT
jgi:hypothetical protein